MTYLDATCPLVSKVHLEAQRHSRAGREIILIGHAGHPEVIGTMGQLPEGSMTLIETVSDVDTFEPRDPENLAFVTQTTLSVDDTAEIIKALQAKFPSITTPRREDICYATTNRQEAVKVMGQRADLFLVIGAETSSNSKRLVEVAKREGAGRSELVASAENVNWDWFEGVETLGITAGASAPEDLVQGLIAACRARFDISVEEITTAEESVVFRLPKILKKDKVSA